MAITVKFPKVDKKMTKGMDPVSFVLQDQGDELSGQYAGSGPYELKSGKSVLAHYFVTSEGLATVLSRYQIDKFLSEKNVKPGTNVTIVRKADRTFKKNGEKMTLHQFDCEVG
jgi:hypothetical protein